MNAKWYVVLLLVGVGCSSKKAEVEVITNPIYTESQIYKMTDDELNQAFSNYQFGSICGRLDCSTGERLINQMAIRFLGFAEGECRPGYMSLYVLPGQSAEDFIRARCESWWSLKVTHQEYDKYAEDGLPEMFDEFDKKYYPKKYKKALIMKQRKYPQAD